MRNLLLSSVILSIACNDAGRSAPDEVDCDGATPEDIEISVTAGKARQPLGADLRFSGTARQKKGLALRRLTVGGVPASLDTANYATWSVVVPASAVDAEGAGGSTGAAGGGGLADGRHVTLQWVAEDACGEVQSDTIPVELVAPLNDLQLEPTLPGVPPADHLPADASAAATVRVVGNAEAVGAKVSLTADASLALTGITDGGVVLQPDGAGKAAARILVTGSKAGDFTIVATSHGKVAVLPLRVAGKPTFFPVQAQLVAGQSIAVTVHSEGARLTCQATPSSVITVTSAGQDLSKAPATSDTDDNGSVELLVAAAGTVQSAATVSVTCHDPFLQSASATFAIAPPPTP